MTQEIKAGDLVDLDQIAFSTAALTAWGAVAQRLVLWCLHVGVKYENVPLEQARFNPDGSLTVFVEITAPSGGGVTFHMNVTADHWLWKQ